MMRRCVPLAAGLMTALLLSLATCVVTAAASESRQPALQIGFASGRDQWSPTLSSPDIAGKSYEIAPPGASERSVDVKDGYSLEGFLAAWEDHTGVSSSRFSLVEVPADDGTTLLTEAEAMSDPSTTTHAPVFWTDEHGSVDFADETPDDYVSQVDQVSLYTGQELTVSVTTGAKQTIHQNTNVRFTAHVTPATGRLQYNWFIVGTNGNLVQAGQTYSYPFALQGSFRVYVVVTGSPTGSSIGVSNQIPINVGPPKRGKARKHHHGQGQRNDSSNAGSGAKGSGDTKRHAKHSGKSKSAAGRSPSTAAAHTAPPATRRRRRSAPSRKPDGPLLSGIAIAGPELGGAERSSGASAPSGRSRAQTERVVEKQVAARGGLHLGEGFWIVLGVLATLSAGMLGESDRWGRWLSSNSLTQHTLRRQR